MFALPVLLAVGVHTTLAQSVELRGVVIEAGSGRPVPQATVNLVGQQKGIGTDSAGRFVLSTSASTSERQLRVRAIGYEVRYVTVPAMAADAAVDLGPVSMAVDWRLMTVDRIASCRDIASRPAGLESGSRMVDRTLTWIQEGPIVNGRPTLRLCEVLVGPDDNDLAVVARQHLLDATRVYRTVLDAMQAAARDDTLVVRAMSRVFHRAASNRVDRPGGADAAASDLAAILERASAKPVSVLTLGLPGAVRTMSEAEFTRLFVAPYEGWSGFQKRYPRARGFVGVSPVAFSTDRRSALVYAEFTCGSLCGSGYAYWLRLRADGTWGILRTELFWEA